jgi:hypothetical protein
MTAEVFRLVSFMAEKLWILAFRLFLNQATGRRMGR